MGRLVAVLLVATTLIQHSSHWFTIGLVCMIALNEMVSAVKAFQSPKMTFLKIIGWAIQTSLFVIVLLFVRKFQNRIIIAETGQAPLRSLETSTEVAELQVLSNKIRRIKEPAIALSRSFKAKNKSISKEKIIKNQASLG